MRIHLNKKIIKKFWLGTLALILLLLLWVNQSVRSTQLSYKIQSVEEELKQESIRKTDLMLQRDQLLSLETIESLAREKLGLIVPQAKDIVIVTISH